MDGRGFSHLSNVGVGTGNSEVICIGVGQKVVGLGECGGKVVEYSSMKGGGEGKVVSAASCTPF